MSWRALTYCQTTEVVAINNDLLVVRASFNPVPASKN